MLSGERQQTKWVLFGFALAIVFFLANFPVRLLAPPDTLLSVPKSKANLRLLNRSLAEVGRERATPPAGALSERARSFGDTPVAGEYS